jgi:hypothetical protein
MAAFALVADRDGLLGLRLAALSLATASLAIGVARLPRPLAAMGLAAVPQRRWGLLLPAVAVGAGLAVLCRVAYARTPLPQRLTGFCLVAGGIGLCEELAYRGFVQGCVGWLGWWGAAAAAAAAHTAYKVCLFVVPGAAATPPEVVALGAATLVVGTAFGMSRRLGSVAFAVAAHVSFDVVAYGDLAAAPWWVPIG